jgi:hypothetical protein
MTSRTYRGIRIVFFLLLVIACLLVSQAAPPSSARRTNETSDDRDTKKYEELSKFLRNEKHKKTYLKKLETSAKCPFAVLNYKGFTRVMCNFSECTVDNSCNPDCRQVYMKAADINPKTSRKKKQVTPADVEMGCIYVPKQKNHSKETTDPGAAL